MNNDHTQDTTTTADLTPEQVQWRLMDLVGYVVATELRDDGEWYVLLRPDGRTNETRNEDLFHVRILSEVIPDWPHDPGAALALCLEIAQFDYTLHVYHGRQASGQLVICADFFNTDEEDVYTVTAATPALALARLALAALEGGAG